MGHGRASLSNFFEVSGVSSIQQNSMWKLSSSVALLVHLVDNVTESLRTQWSSSSWVLVQ
jgi:hypothetical protein